jgi:hypothetical protein
VAVVVPLCIAYSVGCLVCSHIVHGITGNEKFRKKNCVLILLGVSHPFVIAVQHL